MPQSVVGLDDIPNMEPGAPLPMVIATETRMLVRYYTADQVDCPFCVLHFDRPLVHKFGAPNDEALSGHPLHASGLTAYAFAEVENSSWIAELIAQNRVHPRHSDSHFSGYRHFVCTFHDSMLEIIACGYSVVRSSDPSQGLDATMIG